MNSIVQKDALWAAVTNAHEKSSQSVGARAPGGPLPVLDVHKLEAALALLNPDCPERTWMVRRIAPLANAARDYPSQAGELYALASRWSSGKLQGKAALSWTQSGGHGKARRGRLGAVWKWFLGSKPTGRPMTVKTIYYDARLRGWDGDMDEVVLIDTPPKGGA